MRLLPYGARAVLVDFDRPADVLGLHACLDRDPPDGVVELVPAARTLLVRFDPGRTRLDRLTEDLLGRSTVDTTDTEAAEVVVPVHYDGPDLIEVAGDAGLPVEEVVRRHQAGSYVVAFCGFAPGFAYLTGLEPALHVSRRPSPRTRVPAGSVAVAGEYTAVYPHSSPGGWRLIGRTSLPVWDVERDPPNLLTPGTRVRFTAR
ncbi:5-oxoprolinase subunit B family protein [Amycolatopsis suaedae]|uniref:Allophanate hydrolase subunit 1 n=1 Tax=Amycolatopsis suaedae TaxID=2510978 RepID=A0A4Q7J9P1_9PSEU|nr:allophanate hydrolase subunit 1 [Amycolatopsis suaedae]RZQ63622.1 allophanate hydrolase subunit 1 [Amycolatopsis suaedae]